MRDSKGRFVKGGPAHNQIWDIDKIKKGILDIIYPIYLNTGIILQSSHIRNFDSKLFGAFRKYAKSPLDFYNQLLINNNLPLPDSYYKDNTFFRGFYEFIGYCLIKSWGIPIQPTPILDRENGHYISDGLLTEINVYWEHWGQLNKNNSNKIIYYRDNNLKLIQTFDFECQKNGNGISYLYNELKNSLKNYGYNNIPDYDFDYVMLVVKNDVYDFQNIIDYTIKIIKKNGWDNHIAEWKLRQSDEGYKLMSIIYKFFDGSITDLKQYLNNNHGFKYTIKAKRGSYKNINHFVKIITPIVKELGYVPTQQYLAQICKNNITVMASRFCGGLNNLRRNEIEEGEYFYIIKNILGDKAPYDKLLVWKNDSFHNTTVKILQFYKNKGLPFPKAFNYLRNNEEYLPFGSQLHTQISEKQYGGWGGFVKQYGY
jgi:hypothetical protein